MHKTLIDYNKKFFNTRPWTLLAVTGVVNTARGTWYCHVERDLTFNTFDNSTWCVVKICRFWGERGWRLILPLRVCPALCRCPFFQIRFQTRTVSGWLSTAGPPASATPLASPRSSPAASGRPGGTNACWSPPGWAGVGLTWQELRSGWAPGSFDASWRRTCCAGRLWCWSLEINLKDLFQSFKALPLEKIPAAITKT